MKKEVYHGDYDLLKVEKMFLNNINGTLIGPLSFLSYESVNGGEAERAHIT